MYIKYIKVKIIYIVKDNLFLNYLMYTTIEVFMSTFDKS